jgi:tight adherence protein B
VNVRRLVAAAVATGMAGTIALLAVPAQAEARGRIVEVQPGVDNLTIVFTADALPEGSSLDPDSVGAQFGGLDIPDVTAEPLGGSEVVVDRTAILVMDTSGSMNEGGKLDAAKDAAQDYLATVPDDVKVGLITFDDTANVAVQPTTDRRSTSQVIAGLAANGSTALYDAVVLAAATLGTEGSRSALVLSDGEDEGSTATLAQATAAATDSGAKFDAVALGSTEQVAALSQIATATGGSVTAAANAGQLTEAFATSAQSIVNELVVTIPVAEDNAGKEGNVTVTASTQPGNAVVGATAFVAFPDIDPAAAAQVFGPQPVAESGFSWTQPWVLAIGLGLVLLSLTVILVNATRSVSDAGSASAVKRRMSIYTLTGKGAAQESQETTALGDSSVAKSAVDLAGRVVAKRDLESVLGTRLEAAGIPLKASEWTLLHTGIALAGGLLFLLISGGRLVPALIGLALGVVGPLVYLAYKKRKRTNAFLAQLPNTLQVIAGSLSAGYSLPQALDTVTREGSEPMTTEFNRALIETRLGVPIEDALDGIATRMDSEDFRWVVMAIRIQREVGGNLAEVLNTVASTLRERERLRRQIQVLSAEGRLSAVILAGLPVVFTIYLILVRPEYIVQLITNPLGWAMILGGAVLFIVGVLWMRKIVDVEV